jgi:hypothetical protein
LRAGARQRPRLADRVAHGLEIAQDDLVLIGQADLLFGQGAVLAGDRVHREAVGPEDAAYDGRFGVQAHAEREPEVREAAAAREVHDLLDAGETAVAVALDARRASRQVPCYVFVICGEHRTAAGIA